MIDLSYKPRKAPEKEPPMIVQFFAFAVAAGLIWWMLTVGFIGA